MRSYLWASLGIALFVGLTFGLVMALDLPFMQDPGYLLERGGLFAAAFSVFFLALDIVLPVPGSVLMIGNGALFGVWLGTALSLLGGVLSTLLGDWLGRRGGRWLARNVSEAEQERARRAMDRWGLYAVLVSRPIPIVSETMLVMAAAMGLPRRRVILAAVAGLLPSAAIYAAVGAYAVSVQSQIWGFVLVVGLAGVFWLAGRYLGTTSPSNSSL